ncbi:hypothetical protein L249_6995 [Ophiocordyceps polyrhachis-furcata BCC 54312]|uniref:Cytochrome P450 n=1 Tax=Ophiocordyceps polyrhachis-furcata BCC 54312 TaxID=1330021 RepID=A0A367LKC5_9HYPO|nr:hypothetical protein L249_6995 [Ophiocordyceps polyrhachis-furcata BCC 54312]
MALIQYLLTWWAIPVVIIAWYGHSYFVSHRHLRGIPAPPGAQVSDLWLLIVSRLKARSVIVDRAHRKLGKLVRIQPNHVSIADESAISVVYGHGNGFLKSDFYDAFVSIDENVFNTRDRTKHSRKRKLVAHAFSTRMVTQFEPYVQHSLRLIIQKMDRLVETSPHRNQAGKPEARVDLSPWLNYLAFDIIGDLAFGRPLGMLRQENDMVETRATPDGPTSYVAAVGALHSRGEVNAVLGCMPRLTRYARYFPDPFYRRGLDGVDKIAGMAIALVQKRLDDAMSPAGEKRRDIFSRLQQGCDHMGRQLGREELTAEALSYLIAGSDTLSTTLSAVFDNLARHPRVMRKLQAELDEAMPEEDVTVPQADAIQQLPYLSHVIDETLRHHSTSALGLPRQIPADSDGVTILGRYLPPGTILSVPTYTLHHDRGIWGEDADEFRPERWEEPTQRQKDAFNPFSYGPRACVGRNLAELELRLTTATWARRYTLEPREEGRRRPGVQEGF